MKPYHTAGWLLALLNLFSPALIAAECSAQSGSQRVALLELYSSEGCSSCPPADKWVSGLEKRGWGPDKVIPLALHVDYWDYIGWKDRFASPTFTARQQTQAALARSTLVYTPQLTLNGRDYRSWYNESRFAQDIATVNRGKAQANIQLAASQDGTHWKVRVQASAPEKSALYLALTESGLSTEVKAGENRGELLRHDYVARVWQGPVNIPANTLDWETSVTPNPQWKLANARLVAFVQGPGGEVLQALALPFCATP